MTFYEKYWGNKKLDEIRSNEPILQRRIELITQAIGRGRRVLDFGCGNGIIIYASEVIEHALDTDGMFREFNRCLKPSGKLILTCPYHGFLKNVLVVMLNFEKHFNPVGGHIRFYSLKSLKAILRQLCI